MPDEPNEPSGETNPDDPAATRLAQPSRRRPTRRTALAGVVGVVVIGALIALLAAAKPANLQNASSPLLGRSAPPISGPGIGSSSSHALSEFTGRWVLVNFFASWCVPCRQEEPQLEAFQTEHAAGGDATILAVEFDQNDLPSAPAFLRSYHATFPAVDDPAAVVSYGVTGIPETYLVDPAGTIVAKYFGAITAAAMDRQMAKLRPR